MSKSKSTEVQREKWRQAAARKRLANQVAAVKVTKPKRAYHFKHKAVSDEGLLTTHSSNGNGKADYDTPETGVLRIIAGYGPAEQLQILTNVLQGVINEQKKQRFNRAQQELHQAEQDYQPTGAQKALKTLT